VQFRWLGVWDPVITGKFIIFWVYALTISLGLPYSLFKIVLARSYPSIVKGKPSTSARILGSSIYFKYANFKYAILSISSTQIFFDMQIMSLSLINVVMVT
jgi:hypothetical protein